MFWPPSTFTAAKSTTALPAVQVASVLSASFGFIPDARAERHCQPPEMSEATSQATMPSEGGMVIVSRTGSIVFSGLYRLGLLHEEHLGEQHHEAHRDSGVGHVEGGPVQRRAHPVRVEPVPVDEVDDVAAQQAVEGVPHRATEDQRQRHLEIALVVR